MANIPYLFVRKGSPSEADQRAAMLAAGLPADDMAEPWIDVLDRKPRPGQPIRPERERMLGALREGDEVWVMRPALLAETQEDALAFLAEIAKDRAVLRIVSTGRSYSHEKCDEMLLLASDVVADLKKQQTESARKAPRKPRVTGSLDTPQWRLARERWHDARETAEGIAAATGIGVRTLYRHLGERGTPIFGKVPQKRRRK